MLGLVTVILLASGWGSAVVFVTNGAANPAPMQQQGSIFVTATARSIAKATCTEAEKAQAESAFIRYRRKMAAERQAYFATHKKARARATFLKRQRMKLKALQKAADCSLQPPPLPPASSGPPCAPSLARAPLTDPIGFPSTYTEGATDYNIFIRPSGAIRGVVIFVDFPDAPQNEATVDLYNRIVPPWMEWYKEVSYGRASIDISPVQRWFRMPKPSPAYAPDPARYDPSYMQDAIAVADPDVDFSRYQIVYVVPSGNSAIRRGQSPYAPPGYGIRTQDGEVLHATYVGADARMPWVFIHETLHHLGLPDLYDFVGPNFARHVGPWDVMSDGSNAPSVLAWNKWKLGWIDPEAIRCLGQPGQLEETIDPLEQPGGIKAVVVPTGPSTAYVVEVRQRTGQDKGLCDSGVLIYTVDATIRSGAGPIKVKSAHPGADTGACGFLSTAAFDLGSSEVATFEDASVKVDVLATDGSRYRVRVTKK